VGAQKKMRDRDRNVLGRGEGELGSENDKYSGRTRDG
jgi:hypothetical protein